MSASLIYIEVLDSVEVYDPLTLRESNCVAGKDEKGQLHLVEVHSTPHEVYIACGADFGEDDAEERVMELDRYLVSHPHSCRAQECSCPESDRRPNHGAAEGDPCYEPCREQRRQLIKQAVTSHALVRKRGFHGYEEQERTFLKVVLSHAFFAKVVVNWAKYRTFGAVQTEYVGTYDVLPKPVDAFVNLRRIAGFGWASIPRGSEKSPQGRFVVHYDDFLPCKTRPQAFAPPPLVKFFLDIETISPEYKNAESDVAQYPIGMISTFAVGGPTKSPWHKGVRKRFVLKSDAVQEDAHGMGVYDDEKKMLEAFVEHFKEVYPDVCFGYNTNSYDYPYLFRRAARLGVHQFTSISRLPERPFSFHIRTSTSKQNGSLSAAFVNCFGVIFFDMLPDIRKTIKLEAYKLANVCSFYGLGAKGDVAYSQIHPYFHGTVETRMELVEYCDLDVKHCVSIERATDSLNRLRATCEIRRLLPKAALERGLGYQLLMMIRPTLADMGYVNKFVEKPRIFEDGGSSGTELDAELAMIEGYDELWEIKLAQDKYPGATVLKPKPGLITDAVITVDFNSLYPSIMQTFNVCKSTQLPNVHCHPDANVSPAGFAYANASRRVGVLPLIVRKLVEERKRVRAILAETTDPEVRAMLDEVQKALKVAANSVYGLLGTITSDLSSLSAAYSITSWGGKYIIEVSTRVQKAFPVEVVYGDTDSLFIRLIGITDLEQARELGHRIHKWINKDSGILHGALKMGFEDISMRTLLIAKKKYCKLVFPPDPNDPDALKSTWPQVKKTGILNRSLNKFTAETVETVMIMAIVNRASQDELVEYVRSRAQLLYGGRVADLTQLRHSSNLSKALDQYPHDTSHTIAAKQMLHDKLRVEPGDRIAYYFCNLSVPSKDRHRKSEYTVAAHLVTKYSIKWDFYVEELLGALEASCSLIFDCNLKHLLHRRNFDECVGIQRPRPAREVVAHALSLMPGFNAKKRAVASTFDNKRQQMQDASSSSAAPPPKMLPAMTQFKLGSNALSARQVTTSKTQGSVKARNKALQQDTGTILAFTRSSSSSRGGDPRRNRGSLQAWVTRTQEHMAAKNKPEETKKEEEVALPVKVAPPPAPSPPKPQRLRPEMEVCDVVPEKRPRVQEEEEEEEEEEEFDRED